MRIKLLLITILFSFSAFSQNNVWKEVTTRDIASNKFAQRDNFPSQFDLYQTSITSVQGLLQKSPNRLKI